MTPTPYPVCAAFPVERAFAEAKAISPHLSNRGLAEFRNMWTTDGKVVAAYTGYQWGRLSYFSNLLNYTFILFLTY